MSQNDTLVTKSITSINYRGSTRPLNESEADLIRLEQVKAKLDFIARHPSYHRLYEPKNEYVKSQSGEI